jgi:hypothetical protein
MKYFLVINLDISNNKKLQYILQMHYPRTIFLQVKNPFPLSSLLILILVLIIIHQSL